MIKVYSSPTCVYCHALMDWLETQGIEYQELNASDFSDIAAVPVTDINGEIIVGLDRPALKKALQKNGLL